MEHVFRQTGKSITTTAVFVDSNMIFISLILEWPILNEHSMNPTKND